MKTTIRCSGQSCPSRNNCTRHADRKVDKMPLYAAFYARREAGASACDNFLPIRSLSTFEASEKCAA